jgi:hypothetical protein
MTVENAGLALTSPFLPHLLDRLGVLSEADGRQVIAGEAAARRAVNLLQYLADGRTEAPEATLTLNKLLCGLSPEVVVGPLTEPATEDLALCDSLLAALIAAWPAVGSISVAGLRETFLQRQGRLVHGEGRWRLAVQRKSLDGLVDQVPWALSPVLQRWMSEPVDVRW